MTLLGWLVIIYFGINSIMTALMVRKRADWLHCVLAFFFGVLTILMYGFIRVVGLLEVGE